MTGSNNKKGLFLDRDGVINRDVNYLHKIEDFEFLPGIFEVCRFFQNHNYLIFVVTNQSGIGKGYYNEGQFFELTQWMLAQFQKESVAIAKVYFCPFHPTAEQERYRKHSTDRKPNPGMLLKASKEYFVEPKFSVLIGDRESDIAAGINAGIGCNLLLSMNQSSSKNSRANYVVSDLLSILKLPVFT